jgi:hypothetical protein
MSCYSRCLLWPFIRVGPSYVSTILVVGTPPLKHRHSGTGDRALPISSIPGAVLSSTIDVAKWSLLHCRHRPHTRQFGDHAPNVRWCSLSRTRGRGPRLPDEIAFEV